MRSHTSAALLSLLVCSATALGYEIKPFKVDLGSRVPHLKELVNLTRLPETSVLGKSGAGADLTWLKARQNDWIGGFDWEKEQRAMNKFNHSTVGIGNMTVHFIHQRSSNPDAIPLLLTHGWPGSFDEFREVISPLSNPEGKSNTSFHVVVPSLPGFGFTSPAPQGWTLNNTADLFNTLLTDVLEYPSYTAAAGDWGSVVIWALQNNHANRVKAVLYNGLIPQNAPTYDDLKLDPRFADKVDSLSEEQKQRLRDNILFTTDQSGYFVEHSTRVKIKLGFAHVFVFQIITFLQPATIGLALYDNPIGQLAWIGEKYLSISDPLAGIPPSLLNNNTILTSISLYYLTGTFETAGNVYYQNPGVFVPGLRRATSRVPMGFAEYRYEVQYYPEFYLQGVGNLVFHSVHDRGGHFGALDNPPAYLNDVRTMMSRWYDA